MFELEIQDEDPMAVEWMLHLIHNPENKYENLAITQVGRIALAADRYACLPVMKTLLLPACSRQVQEVRFSGRPWDSPEVRLPGFPIARLQANEPEKAPARDIGGLLLALHMLGHQEHFILLLQFLVLSCKSPPKFSLTETLYDDVLIKTTNAIEECWERNWQHLAGTVQAQVADLLELAEWTENQYEKTTRIRETAKETRRNRELTMPNSGCIVFASKLHKMQIELWRLLSWPEMHRTSSLQVTMEKISEILQAFDRHHERIQVHDDSPPEDNSKHSDECEICGHKVTAAGEWAKVMKKVQTDASRFCLDCFRTADNCREAGDCEGHQNIQEPPWQGGEFIP